MSRNAAPFNKLLKSITSNAKRQRHEIQEALIECALFAFCDDRNVDPAKRLFAAVGSGVFKAGMSKWLSLNAPIHFANGVPALSSERQKEMASTLTETEFEIKLREMPAWYEIAEKDNIAPNIWDGAAVMAKVSEYLAAQVKKANKNGDAIAAEKLEASRMVIAAFLNDEQYGTKEEPVNQ